MSLYLGLVGKNGAGKSTVCEVLQKKGYAIFSLSDIVRSEAEKQGLEKTRENLIKIGSSLKHLKGPSVLAEMSLKKAQNQNLPKVVFDSIRHPAEVDFFKHHNVKMLGVDAPLEVRFNRIKARNNSTDNVTLEEFIEHEEHELTGKSTGQHLGETFKKVDYWLENARDLADLEKLIEKFLLSFNSKINLI